MRPSPHLRYQQDLAHQALGGFGTVGIGPVRGRLGLQIRVPIGGSAYAIETLQQWGVQGPIEVVEREPARPRGNPGHFVIKEIHPPPDPSPSTLDAADREFWEEVRASAYDYYSNSGAPKPKQVAARTAWKALRAREGVQLVWGEGRRGKAVPVIEALEYPDSEYLPDADPTIELGPILEYVWIDIPTGNLEVRRWEENPPALHWNKDQKTLYAFPGSPNPTTCAPITDDLAPEVEMYRTWAQRDPSCVHEWEVDDDLVIHPYGVADSVVYRSDKWHARNPDQDKQDSQEYFHQHTDGAWLFQDDDQDPTALLMRGGLLDVEERGIIH